MFCYVVIVAHFSCPVVRECGRTGQILAVGRDSLLHDQLFFSGVPLLLERNAYSLIVEDGILFMSCRSNLLTVLVKYSVALLIFNLFYVSTAKRAVLISPPAWLHLFLLALPSVFALRQWC